MHSGLDLKGRRQDGSVIDVDINLSPTGDGRVIAFVKNTDPRGQKGERRDPEAIPAREARRAIRSQRRPRLN